MKKKRFGLVASVNTDGPERVQPVLEKLFGGRCAIQVDDNEFRIKAEVEGEDVKELNRWLLSELRKVERRTRLRAEWTWNGTTDRFFDYVLKKSTKIAGK